MAVSVVQPLSSSAFVMESPCTVNEHVLFSHPINYCCSLLVFCLFATVSVYVTCHRMKYHICIVAFCFRSVALRKLVVHQVGVRTHMV
jgi:hypothetical protein